MIFKVLGGEEIWWKEEEWHKDHDKMKGEMKELRKEIEKMREREISGLKAILKLRHYNINKKGQKDLVKE